MTEPGYFQLSVKPRPSPHGSPADRQMGPASPSARWVNPAGLEKKASFASEHLSRHGTPPRMNNSPTPQLNSTFSGIRISGLPSTPSPSFDADALRHTGNAASTGKKTEQDQSKGHVKQISPSELSGLLTSADEDSCLIVDMCSAKQYRAARVRGAINISIPPILLKRPQYSINKIADSLESSQRMRLLKWAVMTKVIIYDAESYNVGPGNTIYQVASKFINGNESREVVIVRGGFKAIAREANNFINSEPIAPAELRDSSVDPPTNVMAGLSCELPKSEHVVNPFYNNIRQNQDLIGGVGEPIALQVPDIPDAVKAKIPNWLRSLAFDPSGPRRIADRFLKIEEEELQRMREALNAGASIDGKPVTVRHSVAAGVERGDKNRYNNIWPFENARVRLKSGSDVAGEYINASYLHAEDSERYYIATQGPLPGTTTDFWQMVWENSIRTIVMLTQIVEGGQAKCHSYWDGSELAKPFHLEIISETQAHASYKQITGVPIIVRHFLLSNDDQPLSSRREITHLQFLEWPDLHVIQPAAILALVQEVHKTESEEASPAAKRRKSIGSQTLPSRAPSPIVSHCSAGCGRTGVFCTVDTVIDLVKRQLKKPSENTDDYNIDLIEQTVRHFRDQRLSMVQTLRQFVLCYDAVLLFCADYLIQDSPQPT